VADTGRGRQRAEADPQLIERARTDRAAFGELYDLYVARVYAFCWAYSATREQAEDLTAQTFERALAAIARYEARGVPFSAWLLRIAANLARDRAARSGREVPIQTPAGDEEGDAFAHEADQEADPSPETVVARWERAAWLRALVATLPDDQRRVVELRYWREQSWQEVASALLRSEDAAKQLLRRALHTLASRAGSEQQDG
jgi:RNA polymerase sigma-70 factor (ECF subfamily)